MATPQQQFLNSCTLGETFKVESMLKNNQAELNKADSKGYSPLHLTLGAKQLEVAQLLINLGADVNAVTSKDSYTPLHLAASQGLHSVIPLLVKSGAKVDQKDANGNTPLLLACESLESNAMAAAITLLQNGADMNATNKAKRSAVLLAAKSGKKDLYNQLKDNGADVNAKDSMGTSASEYASSW